MCTRRIYDVWWAKNEREKKGPDTHTLTLTYAHTRTQKIGNKFAGFCVYLHTFCDWLNVFCWFGAGAAAASVAKSTFLTYCSFFDDWNSFSDRKKNESSVNRPATVNACIFSADHRVAWPKDAHRVASQHSTAQQDIDCNETFRYLKLPIVRFKPWLLFFFTVQPKFRVRLLIRAPLFLFLTWLFACSLIRSVFLWLFTL